MDDGKDRMDEAEVQAKVMALFEEAVAKSIQAVNAAPDGAWISGSEMQVRDAFREAQQKAYELMIQARTQAAEAAFSPSEGSGDRQEAAE